MTHWKHRATRCAMPLCEQTRRRGWTTCALYGHGERGVSLFGIQRGMPTLTELSDASGARVPDIGERVMHHVDYEVGTVMDRVEAVPGFWTIYVRWEGDPWPMQHNPDELLDPPEGTA